MNQIFKIVNVKHTLIQLWSETFILFIILLRIHKMLQIHTYLNNYRVTIPCVCVFKCYFFNFSYSAYKEICNNIIIIWFQAFPALRACVKVNPKKKKNGTNETHLYPKNKIYTYGQTSCFSKIINVCII